MLLLVLPNWYKNYIYFFYYLKYFFSIINVNLFLIKKKQIKLIL